MLLLIYSMFSFVSIFLLFVWLCDANTEKSYGYYVWIEILRKIESLKKHTSRKLSRHFRFTEFVFVCCIWQIQKRKQLFIFFFWFTTTLMQWTSSFRIHLWYNTQFSSILFFATIIHLHTLWYIHTIFRQVNKKNLFFTIFSWFFYSNSLQLLLLL